jgi:hypothetical protein
MDTFLLYLHQKKPILLQKYHHIGAVLTWHFGYYYKVDALMAATIYNSFIHTIMYSYYLSTQLKIQSVKLIKKYITFMQLLQFFVQFSNLYFYMPPVENWLNYTIIILSDAYVFGLVILFSIFYYKNYITMVV